MNKRTNFSSSFWKRTCGWVCLALLAPAFTHAQLRVTDLRVEHMKNPSVVDAAVPRLSWVNEASKANQREQSQKAYQIVVASSKENLKKGFFDIWDSGKQESAESSLVPYAGAELQEYKDYYWQVRTWNQDDKVSDWSEVAQWGMGLKNEDWTAKWISSLKDGFEGPLFRKPFTPRGKVKQAKILICGLGFFELYVNGERIGDDYLVPNLSNYSKLTDLDTYPISLDPNFRDYRVLYMGYDVTAQIVEGKNMLGVMLGNGWYHPGQRNSSTYGQSCLRCQMLLTYENGDTETILSDGSWKVHASPIVSADVYKGELYDASLEVEDWCKPEGSEEGWKDVKVVAGPTGQMTAQTSPGDKITEVLKPISLKKTGDKTWEVDFGKEIAGWIYFKDIEGKKGETLTVDFQCPLSGAQERYIFSGKGKETYRPHFTWYTFSKGIIHGVENLTEANLQAEAVNTDVPVTAEFETSNPLFNRINEIWHRSQMDNMHGCIASDCPHREKLPYTGDGEAACETVMLNFDAAAFYQKWIRDMRDSQNKETGHEPNGAPWAPGCGGGVGWGAAMTLMPWWFYVQYGDTRMLQDSYFAMKEQVRYMLTWVTLDGIMFQKMRNWNRGDECYWLNLGDWCPPENELPRDELVHTFYLWHCCDYCARAARAMGKADEQKHYQQLADKVKANFHRYFYDAQNKTYGVGGSNVYALYMGVPKDREADVVATLRHELMVTHKGHLNTGFLCTKYLFETLSDYGLHDVAYTIMNQKDYPSYGWWIEQGATTTWEAWNGSDSHNHPMFGSGLTWFCRRLAGIRADELQPGYRHILIEPCLTELEDVRYALQTPYGKVSSQIVQKDGKREALISIPVGSTATLTLPAAGEIRENGKALDKVKGISLTKQEQGKATLELAQGNYKISF